MVIQVNPGKQSKKAQLTVWGILWGVASYPPQHQLHNKPDFIFGKHPALLQSGTISIDNFGNRLRLHAVQKIRDALSSASVFHNFLETPALRR
jgi:hypothetical protein